MLSVLATVNDSLSRSFRRPSVLRCTDTLQMRRFRVPAEATAQSRFNTEKSSDEPPLASIKSARRMCSGTEQWPFVAQKRTTHNK